MRCSYVVEGVAQLLRTLVLKVQPRLYKSGTKQRNAPEQIHAGFCAGVVSTGVNDVCGSVPKQASSIQMSGSNAPPFFQNTKVNANSPQ